MSEFNWVPASYIATVRGRLHKAFEGREGQWHAWVDAEYLGPYPTCDAAMLACEKYDESQS